MFNSGVLHTSLSGSTEHDRYAPTREEVLGGRGYDYWALGHIHQRSEPSIRSKRPFIAYSGNTQGRHIKEAGAKGCLLITVDDEIESVEFHATDTLRWHRVSVNLQETDTTADVIRTVKDRLVECHRQADGRFCAVRVVVQGTCAAHRRLVQRVPREEAIAEIRNQANDLDEEVWVEKILFETSPPVDLKKLREGADLVGDLLREIDEIAQDEDDLRVLSQERALLADKAVLELRDSKIDQTVQALMQSAGAATDEEFLQVADGKERQVNLTATIDHARKQIRTARGSEDEEAFLAELKKLTSIYSLRNTVD